MGINISANPSLRVEFFSIFFFTLIFLFFSFLFFFFSFFKANMNLTVFAGILLAVTTVTARRASLVEKIMHAADDAEGPRTGGRYGYGFEGYGGLGGYGGGYGYGQKVEKIMRAADGPSTELAPRTLCCGPKTGGGLVQKIKKMMRAADDGPRTGGGLVQGGHGPKVEKIMRAAAKADEPDEAKREAGDETDIGTFIGNVCSADSECCTGTALGECTANGCINGKCA